MPYPGDGRGGGILLYAPRKEEEEEEEGEKSNLGFFLPVIRTRGEEERAEQDRRGSEVENVGEKKKEIIEVYGRNKRKVGKWRNFAPPKKRKSAVKANCIM